MTAHHAPAADPSPGESQPWHAELRELRAAVAAMREALEQAQHARERAVQEALSGAHRDQVQWRDMVDALRQTLEAAKVERDEAVQAARQESRQEIDQLKATATALREALDAQVRLAQERQQAALRDLSDENRQLRTTIGALRDEWASSRLTEQLLPQTSKSGSVPATEPVGPRSRRRR